MPEAVPYLPNFLDAFGHRGANSKSHQWVPGYGGVRIPFVKLRFKGVEIPLLDDARYDPTTYGTGPIGIENPLYLVDFVHTIESFVGASNVLTVKILDPGYSFLEDLLLEKARELELSGFTFSYGWRGLDDSFFRSASTVPVIILNIDFDVTPNRGVVVTLHCIDHSSSLFTGSEYDSFPETDTISSVVTKVVKKFQPLLDVFVATSVTQVGEMKNMEGDSPGKYIKSLLEHASPAGGKTPIYKAMVTKPSSRSGKAKLVIDGLSIPRPIAQYTYGRERQGEMLAFEATVNDRSLALLSGGRVSASSVDPQTKTIITEEHTQDEDDDFHGPRRAVETPKVPTTHTESPQSLDLTNEKSKGDRAVTDWIMWEGTATVLGNTALLPFSSINIIILKNSPTGDTVNLAKANDIYDLASGVWTIWSVTHQIADGTFITLLELLRNSGFKGKGVGGAAIPISFQTVAEGDDGIHSRVLPLENEDSFDPQSWNPEE